jgi:hypothetical protein
MMYKKTHILCAITFFSEQSDMCEIILKNIQEPDMPQMTA